MPLGNLSKAGKKAVGSKQTLKLLARHQVKTVYLAKDAEKRVVDPIIQICTEKSVPIVYAENMLVLGRACGIDVGCAAAAVIEQ
jgi:large subunit ribosomal protein L7A